MSAVIISILIVLVIIIVVAVAAVFTSGSSQDDKSAKVAWRRFYDINFVYNDPPGPRMSRPDGRVTFAGDTDSVSQCQEWCEKDPSCLGYTHVGNTGTAWANQCYLVKSHAHGVAANNKNHQSGWKYYD